MLYFKIIFGIFTFIILWIFIKILPKSIRNFKFLSLRKNLFKEIDDFNLSSFDSSILKNYQTAKTSNIIAFGSVKGNDKFEFKVLNAQNSLDRRNKWNTLYWENCSNVNDKGLINLNLFYNDIKSKIESNFDKVSTNLYFEVDYEVHEYLERNINYRIKNILFEYSQNDNILIGGWPDGEIDPASYQFLENINHPEVFKKLKIEKEESIDHIKFRLDNDIQPDFSEIFTKIESNVNIRLSNPELENLIIKGVNKAFIDFKSLVRDEKIYVFGIHTSSEYNAIYIIGNTLEALNEANEQQPNKDYHKWGFGDWKYSWKISNEELEKASNILGEITNYLWSECKEDESIIDYQAFEWAYDDFFYENYENKYDDKILNIFQKATEGIRANMPDIFFYYQNYDPPREKLLYALNKFNTADKVKSFESEFFKS